MTTLPGPARSTTGWAGAFAEDPSAIPVDIYLSGVRYPGEPVVTGFWNVRWGGPPGGDAMFRIVFLGPSGPVPRDEIDDERVVVVAPNGTMSPDLRPVAKEAAALRETRAGYAISSDSAPSNVAVREALAGRQPERLTGLLRLREAADLSALPDHLGGEVIDLLHEFFVASEAEE
ncbi:MAG TPA: hypothetical protein QGI07_06855 [Dehalococcoidia bacterium]|jgi:hypothetical protein|nr:hypothetical protein [Dehalococcoidia bacterium]HJM53727.1 hypothetical protein [Dehalococcoidia bacterium]